MLEVDENQLYVMKGYIEIILNSARECNTVEVKESLNNTLSVAAPALPPAVNIAPYPVTLILSKAFGILITFSFKRLSEA